MRIGIIGGTGREGRGLALRWKAAGHQVWIGSRDGERGAAKAVELGVHGGDNASACDADVVVLAVPYSAHAATLTGRAVAAMPANWSDPASRSNWASCSSVSV